MDTYIKMENLYITVFISDYVFPNQQKISLDYRLNGQKFLNNKISIAPIRIEWTPLFGMVCTGKIANWRTENISLREIFLHSRRGRDRRI